MLYVLLQLSRNTKFRLFWRKKHLTLAAISDRMDFNDTIEARQR